MDDIKIPALIPALIFYGTYITKAVLLRKEGISANRLAKGDKPFRTRLLEIMLIVVTYGMAILQCLGIAGWLPVYPVNVYIEIAGFITALTGCAFFICGVIAMKSSWRAGVDRTQITTLQTGGILRYSRNPAFLGFNLFYTGFAIMLPDIFLFIFTISAIIVFHLQILEEEKFLTSAFGRDYIHYKQKTGRYFGTNSK